MPNLQGQTIVINTYGGTYADAVKKYAVTPFEAATGAKVTLTTNCCSTFETQIKGQQFAGDVILGADYGPMQAWGNEGLLKADPRLAQIGKARGVDPDYYQSNLVGIGFYAYVLAWNTKYENDHPTSWAEFFDTTKFKATRGVYNLPNASLEIAELGAGTPASSLYPIDTDKALSTLTKLRSQSALHFWKTGAEIQNQLGTGEIAYSLATSGRMATAIKAGLPIGITFNGGLLTGSGAGIPATAKNVDGAVAFVDFFMRPQVQAGMANDTGNAPAYSKAVDLVDPSMRKYMVTDPSNLSQTTKINNDWWLKNQNTAAAAYTKWLTQG